MRWKWILGAVILTVLLSGIYALLSGQEIIADSVTVTVLERPEIVVMEGPSVAYRGDILTFMARTMDQNGNPTPAFLVWSVSDPALASLEAVSDSTVRVTTKARGTFKVRVRVGPLDSLRVGMIDSLGAFVLPEDDPANSFRLAVVHDTVAGTTTQETRQLCALFFSGSEAWGFSPGECVGPWMARAGPYSPPTGPLYRLTVYGIPKAPTPLTVLAALIRDALPAAQLNFRRTL